MSRSRCSFLVYSTQHVWIQCRKTVKNQNKTKKRGKQFSNVIDTKMRSKKLEATWAINWYLFVWYYCERRRFGSIRFIFLVLLLCLVSRQPSGTSLTGDCFTKSVPFSFSLFMAVYEKAEYQQDLMSKSIRIVTVVHRPARFSRPGLLKEI